MSSTMPHLRPYIRKGTLRSVEDDEAPQRAVHHVTLATSDEHGVLHIHAGPSMLIEGHLDAQDFPHLERDRDTGSELGRLVVIEADAVADVMAPKLGQAARSGRGDGHLEHTLGRNARRDGGQRGFEAGLDGIEHGLLSPIRLAHHARTANVRAEPFVDTAHVEAHQIAWTERAVGRPRRGDRGALAHREDGRVGHAIALEDLALEY